MHENCVGHDEWTEIFYSLPAGDVTVGMSTDDGMDVVKVFIEDGLVVLTLDVNSDAYDDEEDVEHDASTWYGPHPVDKHIDLAVFCNTDVNGSTYPNARIRTTA